MSILEIPETSPGRVRAVVRYLVGLNSQRQRQDTLEALLSPPSLPMKRLDADADDDVESTDAPEQRNAGPSMISKVVVGCERMGLIVREDGDVILNPALPREARLVSTADKRLQLTIAELIFARDNPANHELARIIAWYLAQDPLNPPRNEVTVYNALRRTPALYERFALTNVSYGQFEDWVCFLGFAWGTVGPDKKRAITPDPTRYLRWIVGALFRDAETDVLPFAALLERVAGACPVLEGGSLRREVYDLAGLTMEPNVLSAATSQAWLRLEHEGVIALIRKSDAANPVVLVDEGIATQVAEVHLKRRRTGSARRRTA